MTKAEQEERASDLKEKIKLRARRKDNTAGPVLRSTSHLFGRFKEELNQSTRVIIVALPGDCMLLIFLIPCISQGTSYQIKVSSMQETVFRQTIAAKPSLKVCTSVLEIGPILNTHCGQY